MHAIPTRHLEPTQEAGRRFLTSATDGPVAMLNLLRFRDVADYSQTPDLAPPAPVSGAEAYARYMAHTRPHLEASGGEIAFLADGSHPLVGPADERWDLVMIVRHRSAATFVAFASNAAYLAGMGHRVAALEDSRLLPIVERSA